MTRYILIYASPRVLKAVLPALIPLDGVTETIRRQMDSESAGARYAITPYNAAVAIIQIDALPDCVDYAVIFDNYTATPLHIDHLHVVAVSGPRVGRFVAIERESTYKAVLDRHLFCAKDLNHGVLP